MLFCENLEEIVFTRNEMFECDEMFIISGYVGPHPIMELDNLPIKSTVIYGMYGCDGIREGLHNSLVEVFNKQRHTDIYYSTIPVHSKIYMWKNKGKVVHALVGSANFSVNGLTTPFKEVLAETSRDTFGALEKYSKLILDKSIICNDAQVVAKKKNKQRADYIVYDPDVCSMPLYVEEAGKKIVPEKSGLNWGMAAKTGSHVNINDAYIRIGAKLLEHYPQHFPPKQKSPSKDQGKKNHRHNDNIEIIWDDGTQMVGLLEGSVSKTINGKSEKYPKQISTTPKKAELGAYIRKRLNKKKGDAITYEDLEKYGRTTIDVSMEGEGVYYFDFSV